MIKQFIQNLRSDLNKMNLDKYNIRIESPYFFNGNNDIPVVNNKIIKRDLNIPSNIPGIGAVPCKDLHSQVFYKIVINDSFMELPVWVQKAMIEHEKGHIISKKFGAKYKTKEYYEQELQADLHSHSKGHDMLKALCYLMYTHPSLFNIKRLYNLKKATKDKRSLYSLIK